ncbi:hypothetical protein [Anaeromyxobacter terrae]|uniref:hypothetical protein n=1 Tax=Anaeromyxobacter terrae TaxID=2925406 RepID=UPI001F5A825B|nr:hypothetical protein [Anaeromyxobacter sp. SG22]
MAELADLYDCGFNRAMRWVPLAVVFVGLTAVWGGAYLGWRWSRRRLRLDKPDTSDMGKRERDVRRSLRALLAFNFFVMWPVGLPACVMVAILMLNDREMLGPSVAALLGMISFTVAVPSLIATARQLEGHRLSGTPDVAPPSFWIEGAAALIARNGSVGGRWVRYAMLAALLVVGIINWKMTLVMMFYVAIFTGAWAAWKMLTGRG